MINKCGRQLILAQAIGNMYAKKSFRYIDVYLQTTTSYFNRLSKSCLVKTPENKKNKTKKKISVEILIIMLYTKYDRSKSS